MTTRQPRPNLYLSMPHLCSYLPDRLACTMFVDPQHRISNHLFSALMRQGFRRSGDLIYRPHCQECQACVPVRIPIAQFRPNRSQRRTRRKNQDLYCRECGPVFSREHFSLYLRYQTKRHPDGSMNDPDPKKYMDFLVSRHTDTRFFEFRRQPAKWAGEDAIDDAADPGELVSVAVVDVLPDGLSAVYTFFDPDVTDRALGVHAILWLIEYAREHELEWLYLGYWIEESPKMAYKANYRPLEAYQSGRWVTFTP